MNNKYDKLKELAKLRLTTKDPTEFANLIEANPIKRKIMYHHREWVKYLQQLPKEDKYFTLLDMTIASFAQLVPIDIALFQLDKLKKELPQMYKDIAIYLDDIKRQKQT